MINTRFPIIALVGLLTLGAGIAITRRDYNKRNIRLFPGMVYSQAYRPQSDNSNFADGKSTRHPVAGTIARNKMPFAYPIGVDGRQQAGWDLKNPYPKTDENLARGKEVYSNFCLHCHGPQAYGDGAVAQRSLLTMSLHGKVTKQRPDGQLFHIITYGRLNMPAHGPMISEEDRWMVVHYLRELQRVNAIKHHENSNTLKEGE